MSSLIEQAAQRLEQLRQAGVDVPTPTPLGAVVAKASSPVDTPAPTLEPEVDNSPQSRKVEIDLPALEALGFATPQGPRTPTADQFRVIKRPLIANAMGRGAAPIKHGNLIMVTSAVPGEGKSFTSLNLAMSIAAERV